MGAFFLLRGLVAIARCLDYLFFPGFRGAEVPGPVFITGNPRSGTTYLHNLMLGDERFTSMRLIETILPSVCLYRIIGLVSRSGVTAGGRFQRALSDLNRRGFSRWEGIHQTRLEEPEEDAQLFVYSFLTPVITLLFPFFEELSHLAYADRMDATRRSKLMRHYSSSLRRHVYAYGSHRRMLVKNTSLTGRLRTTLEAFPDLTVVHVVRHPYEAIASLLSMYDVTWRRLAPAATSSLEAHRSLAEIYADYYRYRVALKAELGPDRFIEVRFDELVATPDRVVADIYARLGLTMSDVLRSHLDEATTASRTHRSRHRYTLDQFGLSPQAVYDMIPDVFEHYGFDPGPAATGLTTPGIRDLARA